MKARFDSFLSDKKNVLILGFGKEGQSSFRFIRNLYPTINICIADGNEKSIQNFDFKKDDYLSFSFGEHYLNSIDSADLVLKSPGISLKDFPQWNDDPKMSSQTDLFLRAFHAQCIGITGTKGKSTTSSLIYHILSTYGNALLAGNIGTPLFDIIDKIKPQSHIVCEFSSHQLEYIRRSPHIAILLNLFEEHLDHYISYQAYQDAKWNITRYQEKDDIFIFSPKQDLLADGLKKLRGSRLAIPFDNYENSVLKGEHNQLNFAAALYACKATGLSENEILKAAESFKPLPHRLEFVGCFEEVYFYNDSISTIPQAAIAAIEAVQKGITGKKVGCLILGGLDRGIDYQILIDYLILNPIKNIIFAGDAGMRIFELLNEKQALPENSLLENDYEKIVNWCKRHTTKGEICLLSPAAASYDHFKNFEERGEVFKKFVKNKK